MRTPAETAVTASAVIDGEAVCYDDAGVAVFENLHSRGFDDQVGSTTRTGVLARLRSFSPSINFADLTGREIRARHFRFVLGQPNPIMTDHRTTLRT
jgi:ATP-dependent DNA ligase